MALRGERKEEWIASLLANFVVVATRRRRQITKSLYMDGWLYTRRRLSSVCEFRPISTSTAVQSVFLAALLCRA